MAVEQQPDQDGAAEREADADPDICCLTNYVAVKTADNVDK
jgi:hypothetical protein